MSNTSKSPAASLGPIRWYQLTTRRLAIAGMMGAISIVLGITNLGIIPIPPLGVTILHVPVIIAALLEGPLVGAMVGLIFGGFSMYQALVSGLPTAVIFLDPLVALLPRLLIAPMAYWTYLLVRRLFGRVRSGAADWVGLPAAAIVGTLTNTVGVLLMIYLRHVETYATGVGVPMGAVGGALLGIAAVQGLPEAGVAALLSVPVVKIIRKIHRRAR